MSTHLPHRRGFTLIELIIVISVVLILAGSAIGATGGIIRGLRFTNTFNKMVLLVQQARNLAVTGKDASVTEYQINFSRASQTATLQTKPANTVLDASLNRLDRQGMYFYSPGNCNVMTVTFTNGEGKPALQCSANTVDQLIIGLRECPTSACQTVKREKTFSIHKAAGVPQVN